MFKSFFLFRLELGQLYQAYVTEMHPLLIFFFGMVIGALLLFILAASYQAKQTRLKNEELAKITSGFISERLQTEAILNDLELGVMAFAIDGRLRIINNSMREMLGVSEDPQTLADFLSAFGEQNGLKASTLLGTGQSRAELKIGNRVIRLQISESTVNQGGKIATVAVAQDVTREQEQEKQRKDFVANVSHELKTPLTIIKTYSESLLDWGLVEKTSDSVRSDLQRILDDVNRMEALIKDLLLLSSIDSRGKAMHMEEADLPLLLRQIAERCQLQSEEKQIALSCYVVSAVPSVFIDRSAMDRVFMNLIQNAIKYSDKKGRIDIFISRMWDDVVVKVKDNGQGIDPKYQKAIFERFYRVDNTGSRKYGGTGLGLSIAKELTELHHGKISVQSMPTQGSEFSVTLPSAAKLYRQVMLSLVQQSTKTGEDILLKQAADELLQQAHDMGMKAATLQDLTRAERDSLMQPYRIDDVVSEDSAEDFANVLTGEKDTLGVTTEAKAKIISMPAQRSKNESAKEATDSDEVAEQMQIPDETIGPVTKADE
ncbi:MAG: hypothetical protein EOM03_12510 [Clostridia bacterium]|nr:hypothetical protein [Clostridia bacterium]